MNAVSNDRWTCPRCIHTVFVPDALKPESRQHYLNQSRDHHAHICPKAVRK